jgi:hypothetical protein
VEARAELSSCHAANREAAAEAGSLFVEATVAEVFSGLATIYLAAESFFRPIWGRYFTTEYPPDRSTPSLPRLSYVHYFYQYLHTFYFIRLMAWLQNGVLEAARVCWTRVRGARRESDTSTSSGRHGRQVSHRTYMDSHTSMGSFHSPVCLPSPLDWGPLTQLYSSRMPIAHHQVSSTMAGLPDMGSHT